MSKKMNKTKKTSVKEMTDITKQKHNMFYYLLPWNLKKEIALYGYSFDTKEMVKIYAVVLIVAIILGKLFKFTGIWYVPLIVSGILFTPKLIRNKYRNQYEYTRFSDVNLYIEQMLYAFKNSGRILTTLKDVLILFPEKSAMREVIQEACDTIERPNADKEGDGEAQGLAIIEKRYPNAYIKQLHTFMLRAERIGGTFDSSIDLLLKDRVRWENRVQRLRGKQKNKHTQIMVSCCIAVLICVSLLYILPQTVDLGSNLIVRIVNVVMVVCALLIYTKADTKLATDLVSQKKQMKLSEVKTSYNKYLKYNPNREMKKSLMYSIVPLIFTIIGGLLHMRLLLIGGAFITIIMLFQHKIGHNLLGKRMRREISQAFPQWLMELALLLQSNNVQVAIMESIHDASPIMRLELERFKKEITAHPDSSEPFLNFFGEFHMPEITTSMQMLYSLSVGSGGDAEEQIANIIDRNNLIMDRAAEMADNDSMASMEALFLAPVMVGGLGMLIIMTVFLLLFMQAMSF